MKRRLLISCLLATLGFGVALPLAAQDRHAEYSHKLLAQAQSGAANAAEAAKIAKRRYGGKVLKVDTIRSERGVSYRVKLLLDNGRVRSVVIRGQ